MSTAMWAETQRLAERAHGGFAVDIFKCFDQVQRPLLFALLDVGGFPQQVLGPYSRFMNGLTVRNSLAGCLGVPYSRVCSIPQGCPLSMTFLSFLLRPWALMIQSLHAIPRTLADDLSAWTSGPRHLFQIQVCLSLTHRTR